MTDMAFHEHSGSDEITHSAPTDGVVVITLQHVELGHDDFSAHSKAERRVVMTTRQFFGVS